MQFQLTHDFRKQTVEVLFTAQLFKYNVVKAFESTFTRIGGTMDDKGLWTFPSFVSSSLLQEIIKNTCFVCGGLMKDSTAMLQGECYVESYDNFVNTYQGVIKHLNNNDTKQIKVRKCSSCGHSHT
jgi:hypothetical protein